MMTGQFQCDICKNELQEIKIENDLSTVKKTKVFFFLIWFSFSFIKPRQLKFIKN